MEYKDKVTVDQEFKDIVYPLIEFWKQCSEKELERLIRKFGHICRKEFPLYRSSVFLKIKCLSDILLSIAEDYRNNNVILIDIYLLGIVCIPNTKCRCLMPFLIS